MITTEKELKELIDRAVQAPCIALDTEFFWERTFYPILGVVQLGFDEEDCHLIDAVALPDLPHFGNLLEAKDTVKILHDAKQDLAILSRCTNTTPCNIFDTRRAAGFAGMESTLSLANLLKKTLDIDIPKTETRSNWLKRPLTQDQIDYAVNDVAFMPELRNWLIQKAAENGNAERLFEEMKSLDNESYDDATPEEIFRRLKASRLNSASRTALLELIRWREKTARDRDIPRGHVIKNGDLITIAAKLPQSLSDLQNISKLPRSASTRHSSAILKAIRTAKDCTPVAQPAQHVRLTDSLKKKIDSRLKLMRKRAGEASIDPALIAPKAVVTDIVLAENAPADLFETPAAENSAMPQDWRREFLEA